MDDGGRRETVAPRRLFGLDAARGVALLGMFVAHTVVVSGELVVDGRSAILFATVAGVSLGLITGGATPPPRGTRSEARMTVLVRGCVLVLLGLALTTFLRPPIAVILDFYGFAFLLLIGPLFARRLVLAAIAAVVAVAAPPLVGLARDAAAFEDLAPPVQLFARWLTHGEYPMLVWIAYLLFGLILARSDLRTRLTAAAALVVGTVAAILGYSAAALVPGLTAAAHSDSSLEVLASGGVAVAIIGALSLLDSATGEGERAAAVLRVVLSPVAAAGSMSLTLYVAHAVVLAVVRDALAGSGQWTMPDWVLPTLVVGALVFAAVWRRLVGPGPLEAGLRVVTRLVTATRLRVTP
jgi:Predicted membrane protein